MQSTQDPKKLLCDPDEEIRLLGLRELACAGVENSLPAFFESLGDESWRVRKEAVQLFLSSPRAIEFVDDIVGFLHSEENAGLRNAAVEILVHLGRTSVPPLLREISSSDPDVRKFALDILGEIRDDTSLGSILKALQDPDLNVRASAAENLGKLGIADAVPDLLDAMSEEDLWFRFTILEALGQIGAEIPTERLHPYFEDKLLRKALFDCLGKVGGADSLNSLVDGLSDDMRNVREAAVTAILGLVARFPALAGEIPRLAGTPAAESVVELLSASNPVLRSASLKLLGLIGDGRFALRLLNLSDDDGLLEEVADALVAMGRTAVCPLIKEWERSDVLKKVLLSHVFGETGCLESIPFLINAIKSPDDDLRLVAAISLGKLKTVAALPALATLLSDFNEDIRVSALEALLLVGEEFREETIEVLRPLLEDQDPEVRSSAVLVLGRLDGPEVEKCISFALKDESALVRQSVIRAFEGKSGAAQLEMFMLALTDEDGEVRRLAVEALGISCDSRSLAPLELALQDDDLWVRSAAVRALGRLTGPEAESSVLKALDDAVGLVVIAALETLASMRSMQASSALAKALDHPDEEVVNAALHLLAVSDKRDWIPLHMEKLVNHPHWEVRNSLMRILSETREISSRPVLEQRLLVEEEEIVRQGIRDVLSVLGEGEE